MLIPTIQVGKLFHIFQLEKLKIMNHEDLIYEDRTHLLKEGALVLIYDISSTESVIHPGYFYYKIKFLYGKEHFYIFDWDFNVNKSLKPYQEPV